MFTITSHGNKETLPVFTKSGTAENLSDIIKVPSDLLGFCHWRKIIELTQSSGIEHGMVVSRRKNNLYPSQIFEGTINSFTPPLWLSIINFLHRRQETVMIHGHCIPEGTRAKTTTFSSKDINLSLLAIPIMVMVDQGGAHLLLRDAGWSYDKLNNLPDFEKLAFGKTATDKTIAEVISETTRLVRPYGARYFYNPNPVEDNGLIKFSAVTQP